MFDSSTKGTPERAGPNVTHVRSRPRGFSTSGVPRHVMPMRASNQIFAHTVLLARGYALLDRQSGTTALASAPTEISTIIPL